MQSLSWYWNRLSLMSPGEIAWRSRRMLRDRLDPILPRFEVPAANRSAIALQPWEVSSTRSDEYTAAAQRVLDGQIDLFGDWVPLDDLERARPGERVRVRDRRPSGTTIDYRDARVAGDARAIWEANRHFQLVMLAQAWMLSRDRRYRDGALQLIREWLRDNPCPQGLNWTSALESGIRLINWYVAIRMLGLSADELAELRWLDSIYEHSHFIRANQSRFSSANNHLIGEMAGLYIAATAWPAWPESSGWRAAAKNLLEREARRQVHRDGVSKEQTVCYQTFVLQFLIVAAMVGEQHGEPFSREYWSIIRKMMVFLRSITDASGRVPDFGDSDEGIVLMLSPHARARRFQDLVDLERCLGDPLWKPDSEYSAAHWLLGGLPRPLHWPPGAWPRERAFSDGGYIVLGQSFGCADEVSLAMDVGPLGYLSIAAHGHADCLSFTLSIAGEQILIDPGTCCYHSAPEWRDFFRGTSAHNTICVDGLDQSEIAGPFMWLRRARPMVEIVDVDGRLQRVRAAHDGYLRLRDPVTHTREVEVDLDARVIAIHDRLHCRGKHSMAAHWHLAEGCSVAKGADGSVAIETRGVSVALRCEGVEPELFSGSHEPRLGWVSRRFGKRTATTTVRLRQDVSGDSDMRTTLRWQLK